MKSNDGVEYPVDTDFKEMSMPKSNVKDYDKVKVFLQKNLGKITQLPNGDVALLQSIFERDDSIVIVYNKLGE